MKNQQPRSYSIIIPTYNEEKDIKKTLEYVLKLNWSSYDIIVVDDSTDSTPDIVRSIKSSKIRLLIPEHRKGRSEARNLGIKASTADVVIILNADVLLHEEFITQINKYYQKGYQSVSCMNSVKNTEKVCARLLEARKSYRIKKGTYKRWDQEQNGVVWTEGFSVLRKIALTTELFPSDYPVEVKAGEDAIFAERLCQNNCKGYFADEIDVKHVAPERIGEFWNVRVGRGEGTPQIKRYIRNWSFSKIFARNMFRLVERLVKILLVFPYFAEAFLLSKAVKNRFEIADVAKTYFVLVVEKVAYTYGENYALRAIIRAEKHLNEN